MREENAKRNKIRALDFGTNPIQAKIDAQRLSAALDQNVLLFKHQETWFVMTAAQMVKLKDDELAQLNYEIITPRMRERRG